ncbi:MULTISPECIES: hypothetical protein [unclassified Mesorhizobium]|uniref:hypothetical protein n=1 Tax=unclassified Mesorhizobium TaxID=325217 RepID=UPI000FCAB29B|nr:MULTISPECIES: hypothetical protein [unclassified Mesorhizobium]RUU48316.1 hypothetical protein EOD08_03055 [Mesorhizobium sp. M6A.T.Ca.TU.002.02.2.1]RUU43358.1 hypothetical protein EOC93_15205 [Mesorhizobium sp. M6A.T.Ce.TU.002.03.1.1]RUV02091.1 hypothetical protein EOB36_11295 [Mesorhizobium sp. M6A.T.Cr.TU.017.01.1.1]RVB79152.1 hypothetical protein EN885_07920 [Mesorhizobium sp. M6A.T.Cr.TU.014.01.1.1]RWN69197.1 MAG: hypothetical protein EOR99_04495 [Mesorhizobium sp.]
MEVVVRQSPESSWAYFAFVCSIAVACVGAAAGGERGEGNSAGNHGGGGNSAGSHHGEGRKGGSHKGPGAKPSGSSSSSPVDDDGTSTAATAAVPATPAATAVSVARSAGAGRSLDLPANLQPLSASNSPSTVRPIKALPGVPDEVVRACHDAIESAAAPFGATSVRVNSAGSIRRLSPDTISAPVEVSIDYGRQGNVETRQAPIKCELNATGRVIGLT